VSNSPLHVWTATNQSSHFVKDFLRLSSYVSFLRDRVGTICQQHDTLD